jgi:hypothetical protein
LPKALALNLRKPLDLATSLEEVWGLEEHVKLHHENIASQTEKVDCLQGQMTCVLSQVNSESFKKKQRREKLINYKRLKRHMNQSNMFLVWGVI